MRLRPVKDVINAEADPPLFVLFVQTRTQSLCSLYYDSDGALKGNTSISKIKKCCKLLWVRDCSLYLKLLTIFWEYMCVVIVQFANARSMQCFHVSLEEVYYEETRKAK